jgi:ribosomal protein S18 acetylase RimI-like enzyme
MQKILLTQSDFREIAILHSANIDQGFLSSLGVDFLALLYQAISESDKAVLFCRRQNGAIVGFVSASYGMRHIYIGLLKLLPSLLWALRSVFISYSKIRKILELLFRPNPENDTSSSLIHYELLSIAINSDFRGQGIAQDLYKELCAYYRDNGVAAFKIVVGGKLAPAHRFYLACGAKPVDKVQVHTGEDSTVYVQELLHAELS